MREDGVRQKQWRVVQPAERLTLDQEVGGSSPPPPATKFQVRAFSTLLRSATLASEAGLGHWAHDQGQPQPRRDTVVEQRDRLAGHINLQAAATARAANRKLIAVAADLAVLPPGWAVGGHPRRNGRPGGTRGRGRLRAAKRQTIDHETSIWRRRKVGRAIPALRAALRAALHLVQQRWARDGQTVADQLNAKWRTCETVPTVPMSTGTPR
jgi:hypothetical protein